MGVEKIKLLEKLLSPELIERHHVIIKNYEEDYNRKIRSALGRFTTPIGHNTVITHVDINYLNADFSKERIEVEKDVAVLIILGRGGFDKFRGDDTPDQAAILNMKEIISTTFNISKDKITINIAP